MSRWAPNICKNAQRGFKRLFIVCAASALVVAACCDSTGEEDNYLYLGGNQFSPARLAGASSEFGPFDGKIVVRADMQAVSEELESSLASSLARQRAGRAVSP